MSGRSFSDAVILVRIREPGTPVHEAGKSSRELVPEPAEVVATKSVDRDHYDKGRFRGRGLRGRSRRGNCYGRKGAQIFRHAPIWTRAPNEATYGAIK